MGNHDIDRSERGYRSVELDSLIAASSDYLDIKELLTNPRSILYNFTPLGIMIGRNSENWELSYAKMPMTLWDDSGDKRRHFRPALNVMHPIVPGKIFRTHMTGADIILVGY